METKLHKLTQDNGGCNNFDKITVEICDSDLINELKNYFGWRKDVGIKRLQKQGSSTYDSFIKYLAEQGYQRVEVLHL